MVSKVRVNVGDRAQGQGFAVWRSRVASKIASLPAEGKCLLEVVKRLSTVSKVRENKADVTQHPGLSPAIFNGPINRQRLAEVVQRGLLLSGIRVLLADLNQRPRLARVIFSSTIK